MRTVRISSLATDVCFGAREWRLLVPSLDLLHLPGCAAYLERQAQRSAEVLANQPQGP